MPIEHPKGSGQLKERYGPALCQIPVQPGVELCPNGTPQKSKRLSSKNYRAWRHFEESRAVGFSELERADAIVRRNAVIIQAVTESLARERELGFRRDLTSLAAHGLANR